MMQNRMVLTSTANPRIKGLIKLRQRSHRDSLDRMLIEGFREILRALDNDHPVEEIFTCPELYQGTNNEALVERAAASGARVTACSSRVFQRIAYRDRPDGLVAVAPQVRYPLSRLSPRSPALLLVAESIEKPGNLGSILRSADGAGADAVIVCDRCTDINNPNVVRASIGTIFSRPVIETESTTAIDWCRQHEIEIVATTPSANLNYSDVDLSKSVAIVLGTEQYGLSQVWLDAAVTRVRIPMLGQSDSLNVATAATLLLYEAVRQRGSQAQSATH